ncbi:hypothetical protein BDN72DRAFT_882380 [Pluteus cervinus]|uniref:Uncharacterized protein n=1 Tax=Pluteus cervinus TaxID=181527 RepID=A0ACD3AC69_9AGAR|nr:hypothetical protein BDN72DRAFT_882380 [Pluteus cervinus]
MSPPAPAQTAEKPTIPNNRENTSPPSANERLQLVRIRILMARLEALSVWAEVLERIGSRQTPHTPPSQLRGGLPNVHKAEGASNTRVATGRATPNQVHGIVEVSSFDPVLIWCIGVLFLSFILGYWLGSNYSIRFDVLRRY